MQKRLKKSAKSLLLMMGACFALAGCSRGHGNKTTFEYVPGMMDNPAIKAQEEPMRTPPAGTIPRDFQIYPYKKDQGDLAASLPNPLPRNKKTLLLGKKTFNTYCIVCHGPGGKGNGFIVPRFPMPPSLHSEKVKQWSDGRIFHVITMGQNLMSSYASQVTVEERWAVIQYVRALQRSMDPTDEDVAAYEKALQSQTHP